ncbi:MAG: hypothetical protein ACP5OB_05145 [Candidatus Ratteibacteria bacterium]
MIYHKKLAEGKWFKIPFCEQMANIGMEILRGIRWKNENEKNFNLSIERAIELIDLTKIDPKNKKRLKEICRLKEVLIDYFWGKNEFNSSDEKWENYFNPFLIYASKLREKRRLECQR